MDILMVPTPLFNKEMAVGAYYFRYRKGNDLMLEAKAASFLDGAMNSPLLETLRLVGIEPLAMDKPIFVPVSSMMLLGDLSRQCPKPYEKIIFILDGNVLPNEEYLRIIRGLKENGFRFAMHRIERPDVFAVILAECEYLFLNQKTSAASIRLANLPPHLRHLKLVATHIESFDIFNRLADGHYAMFEGSFYRLPITKGRTKVAPLKVNLVRLLNTVQDREFDFQEISSIIERDPALSISLLQMVNSPYLGLSEKIKTISHAVTMLGESEVRKWATTSVSRLLGSDKPDEVTKLSLIRAKFAENMAPLMKMQEQKQSLFLTGLFSVLDVVLELTMQDALAMVRVDDDIKDALVNRTGIFYPTLDFIFSYERSDWTSVSRRLILDDVSVEDVYDAYISATLWYKDLIEEKVEDSDGDSEA